jgi:hypothetical protein
VRELEPQVNEGDDDPVGERQVMGRPGAGRAKPRVQRQSTKAYASATL